MVLRVASLVRSKMVRGCLVGLLAAAGAGLAPALADVADVPARAADLAAARAVFERNLDAIRAKDAAAYLACYWRDESLTRNGPAGVSIGYAEWAKSVGEGWPSVFDASHMHLTWIRPGVVYGSYRYRVRFGDDEQIGISERVLIETEAGWKIAVTTAFPAPPGTPPPPVALVGGTIRIGESGDVVPESVVLVRDGKIECAGAREACAVPDEAEVVDVTGRWVVPGTADAEGRAVVSLGGDPGLSSTIHPAIPVVVAGAAADLLVLAADPVGDLSAYETVVQAMTAGELRDIGEYPLRRSDAAKE